MPAATNNGRWDIGDIKLKYRLNEIVERAGVQLKRAGSHRWQGLCPFHADWTPSFFVDVDRERFTCFGCKTRGDVIDFVRLHERLKSVAEACAWVTGTPPPSLVAKARTGCLRRQRATSAFLSDTSQTSSGPAIGAANDCALVEVRSESMFRLVVKRNRRRLLAPAEQLLEVITPRTNAALITPAENLCASLSLHTTTPGGGPVALEIVGDGERSRFFLRSEGKSQQRLLQGQVGTAYPQATLRSLDPASMLSGDPLRVGSAERIACSTLALRDGEHLPIRTFHDRELDADSGVSQVDPVLGILRAVDDLPVGWRALSQLVLIEPAPRNWSRAYQRLPLQNPVAAERSGTGDAGSSLTSLVSLFGLGLVVLVALNAWTAWQRDDWAGMVLSVAGLAGAIGIAVGIYLRFVRRDMNDPRLVQDKLSREACRVELRLAVIAPNHASPVVIRARLERLVAAYRPYALAAGNSLLSTRVRSATPDLRILAPLGKTALLNVRELAGLWHLPQAADDVPFIERTTARIRLPLPASVGFHSSGEGCRIGRSDHPGAQRSGGAATRAAAAPFAGDCQNPSREVVADAPVGASPDAGMHDGARR